MTAPVSEAVSEAVDDPDEWADRQRPGGCPGCGRHHDIRRSMSIIDDDVTCVCVCGHTWKTDLDGKATT